MCEVKGHIYTHQECLRFSIFACEIIPFPRKLQTFIKYFPIFLTGYNYLISHLLLILSYEEGLSNIYKF